MAVHVKYGPQNEEQETLYNNVQNYKNGDTNKSYYDSLFLGTPYEDQYNAIIRKYQSVSLPQSFSGWLTGRDETSRYNHEISLMDELESLATKMYDEDYQSPSSDVSRLRAAGINPDLNGLSGQAAPQKQGGNIPSVQAENPLEVMSNTLSTVMQIYSTIKGFKGINLHNESLDLSNIQDMMNIARPMIIENFAKNTEVGSYGSSDWADVIATYNPFKGNSKQSKRFAQAFMMELSSGHYAAAESAYKRLAGLEEGRWQYGSYVGNPHWSPDDNALYHYVGGMMQLSLASEAAKHRFDSKYWDTLSPKLKAGFENAHYDADKFLYRLRASTYKHLQHDFNNGSLLAGLLVLDGFPAIAGSTISSLGNFLTNSMKKGPFIKK